MTFQESLGDAVRQQFCTMLGTYNNFYDYMSRLPFFIDVGVGDDVARMVYRNVCNREPPPLPEPIVPGGQCVDVPYKYQLSFEWEGNAYGTNWIPVTIDNFNKPNIRGRISFPQISGGTGDWRLTFTAGNEIINVFQHTSGGSTGYRNIRFDQIYRADGLPDDCGVVPAPVPPPAPNYNTENTTVNYNDYSNNSVDVDLNITIGSPQLRIDGDVNIPVRIFSPDTNIEIGGSFSVNDPTFNFNFGDNNYAPSPSPNGSDYGTPADPPECPVDVPTPIPPTDPSEPEPETRRTIRGVLVTVTEIGESSSVIFQEDNPNIYIPNLGFIQFLCQVGNSAAWTVDMPVKNRRHLIQCPWDGGAIAVRGTPRSGVSWVLTEIYAVEEDKVSFEVGT